MLVLKQAGIRNIHSSFVFISADSEAIKLRWH